MRWVTMRWFVTLWISQGQRPFAGLIFIFDLFFRVFTWRCASEYCSFLFQNSCDDCSNLVSDGLYLRLKREAVRILSEPPGPTDMLSKRCQQLKREKLERAKAGPRDMKGVWKLGWSKGRKVKENWVDIMTRDERWGRKVWAQGRWTQKNLA